MPCFHWLLLAAPYAAQQSAIRLGLSVAPPPFAPPPQVGEIKKRQKREQEAELARQQKQLEREKHEREMRARVRAENEQVEKEISALNPKIDAMEASWIRLRTICGAETVEDVMAYWKGERCCTTSVFPNAFDQACRMILPAMLATNGCCL